MSLFVFTKEFVNSKVSLAIVQMFILINMHGQALQTKPIYNLNKENGSAIYKFSFAHITDTHIGEGFADYGTKGYVNDTFPEVDESQPAQALINAVRWINENYIEKNIKFVIVSGDLTSKAQYSEFMKFKQIMSELAIPYVPMIGNHDVWQYVKYKEEEEYATADSLMNVIFDDVFEKNKQFFDNWNDGTRKIKTYNPETGRTHYFHNYSFEYDGFIFYALDFNPRYHVNKEEPGIGPEAQLYDYEGGTFRWLSQSLKNNPNKDKKNICFISHHPPIDNIFFVLSNFVFELDEYDKLTKMLIPYINHTALWLAGHVHLYYSFPFRTLNKLYNFMPLRVIPANKDFPDAYIQTVNVYLEDNITTSIQQKTANLVTQLYPNPANDLVSIELKNYLQNATYKLFDVNGNNIANGKIVSLQKIFTIDVSTLPAGNYFLQIIHEAGIDTKQIIKQ